MLFGIFIQSFYIGIANNLPTGPVSAYLVATRAQNTYQSIIAVIGGVLLADLLHLYVIGSLPNHFSIQSIHPLFGIMLSVILFSIGAHMTYRGFYPKEGKTLMQHRENLGLIALYAFFLNAINPFAIISMLAFLNASKLLPIQRSHAWVVYSGYALASLGVWCIYGIIVQKYIHVLKGYTKNIIIICGITIMLFGFSYLAHEGIQIVTPYLRIIAEKKHLLLQ